MGRDGYLSHRPSGRVSSYRWQEGERPQGNLRRVERWIVLLFDTHSVDPDLYSMQHVYTRFLNSLPAPANADLLC